ncbi:uncharacterized protein LOC127130383 [Lathyrus oleraceus]|uniref:uncharacterized protein LOC127130383 n=1 Tax=Pisum sativum TaxID=3888 RepID=UPI0021D1943E|nr:uncharacterized protein LOC127130383 [Pisum sativum]
MEEVAYDILMRLSRTEELSLKKVSLRRFGPFAKDRWSNKERKSEETNIDIGDSDYEHLLLMAYESDVDEPVRLTISDSEGDFKYESESEDESESKSESKGFKAESEDDSEAEVESEDDFEVEGEVASEEDSASEVESESENKYEGDSEDEEDSKGEPDSEGESDFDPDSDDDPESGGNQISGNGASGGGAFEGRTYEDIDFNYEDESEIVNDFESESESKGEIDFEEESDSDPDAGGDSDSGDPDSDGDSNSGGSPDSRNIPDSEGGHAFEVSTYGVLVSDNIPELEGFEQVQRPQRIRNISKRFVEFDMLQDTEIDSEGEVIQCCCYARNTESPSVFICSKGKEKYRENLKEWSWIQNQMRFKTTWPPD